MTYLVDANGTVWSGAPINGVQHPANIVDLWSDAELSAIGLTRITPQAPTAEELAAAARASMSMTFAQLLIGLVTEAWITEAEGEAWLTGTLPAPVLSLIATLPAEQRFAAKARAITPSIVLRNDPLVASLGAAQGKTAEQLDTFFTTYAQV